MRDSGTDTHTMGGQLPGNGLSSPDPDSMAETTTSAASSPTKRRHEQPLDQALRRAVYMAPLWREMRRTSSGMKACGSHDGEHRAHSKCRTASVAA